MTGPATVDVRRSGDRFRTRLPWLDSAHSFSFGRHYDGGNTSHGLLLASNDDVLRPGSGYPSHPHRDLEIVTWVLQGSLVHRDSTGHVGVIRPGLAQRMSAGSGVVHAETNEACPSDAPGPAEDVRFVQMWVVPDGSDRTPGYEQRDLGDARLSEGLVPVASGRPRHAGEAAVRLGQRDAALLAARLRPGQAVHLPEAAYVHLYVARGAAALEGAGPLAAGDAVRLTGSGGQRLTATEPAEVLVWEMHAGL